MPVCSNCGGNDFVWADNLKTGSIGRGTLSLRTGGELAIGTRVCRGCGHADLFVKDPTVLRQPHTWKPGEFIPIPPKPAPGPRPGSPTVPSPLPSGPPSPVSPIAAPPPAPPVPPPAPAAPPAASPPAPETPTASTPSASEEAESGGKKPTRRKGSKSKPPSATILQS